MSAKKVEKKVQKGPTGLPIYLNIREFRLHIVNWSNDSIYRAIHNEELPAMRRGKSYLFPTQEVLDWFKRRHVRAG